jgi:uroporphyrinogen-III synthase
MLCQDAPQGGSTILLTRAREESEAFCVILEGAGFFVENAPLQEAISLLDEAALRAAIASILASEGILLTSARSVRYLLAPALALLKEDAEASALFRAHLAERCYCVGEATAQACRAIGISSPHLPERHDAKGLLAFLAARDLLHGRFVFPCSALAREALVEGICEGGGEVRRLPCYTMRPLPLSEAHQMALLASRIGVVALCSPSQLVSFRSSLGASWSALPASLRWAAIGETTAQALKEAGLRPWLIAPQANLAAYALAIRDALVA